MARKPSAKAALVEAVPVVAAEPAPVVIAYKGFDAALACHGYQYEVGKTYKHDGDVEACQSGFHACEHPLNVFNYYAPATSRYAEVELSGKLDRHRVDTKIASAVITIKAELNIPELVARAIRYVFDRAKPEGDTATGYQSAASATGDQSAASATGTQGAASATGYQSAASATGYQSAASATGYRGAASATGDQSAASATGYQSAASATGDQSAASATGYRGAASATGYQSAASATGRFCGAYATGIGGMVSGVIGSPLHLDERIDNWGEPNHGEVIATWSGIVGKTEGIEPGVFYRLIGGKPVAVKPDEA